jgi:hypothetical protein
MEPTLPLYAPALAGEIVVSWNGPSVVRKTWSLHIGDVTLILGAVPKSARWNQHYRRLLNGSSMTKHIRWENSIKTGFRRKSHVPVKIFGFSFFHGSEMEILLFVEFSVQIGEVCRASE